MARCRYHSADYDALACLSWQEYVTGYEGTGEVMLEVAVRGVPVSPCGEAVGRHRPQLIVVPKC